MERNSFASLLGEVSCFVCVVCGKFRRAVGLDKILFGARGGNVDGRVWLETGVAGRLPAKRTIQSLRAARFTPAFGRLVRVCDPGFYGTAEAVPLRGAWAFEGSSKSDASPLRRQ